MKNLFIFDVEATSLHGEGFAVGAIVIDPAGKEIDSFEMMSVEGANAASEWVQENVIPHLDLMSTCVTNKQLRDAFFEFYMKHKETCEIWSDVNYPVETNFLAAILADNPIDREWSMPYPLKDISTLVDMDIDRHAVCGIHNLQKHNPLDDSRASAECLKKVLAYSTIYRVDA